MKNWLSYANLSDAYERKARFAPALLTVLFLAPLSLALKSPLGGWLNVVITGVGAGAIVSIGLSHLASAAGNRLQKRLWPQWPLDSPTNRWLHPDDSTRSQQQKAQWYDQIQLLTGLDVRMQSDDLNETERIINDTVVKIRYLLRNSDHADRLRVHNADLGFARNLAGLIPVGFGFSILGLIASWWAVLNATGLVSTAVFASILTVLAIAMNLFLPSYVRTRADSYAESFFGAMAILAAEMAGH